LWQVQLTGVLKTAVGSLLENILWVLWKVSSDCYNK